MVNDQWPINNSHLRDKSSAEDEGASIDFHIEELVLHGFSPGDRYGFGEALERELVFLLRERGVPPSMTQEGEFERLDAGTLTLSPDWKADRIGVQVAQAVYKGLSR